MTPDEKSVVFSALAGLIVALCSELRARLRAKQADADRERLANEAAARAVTRQKDGSK